MKNAGYTMQERGFMALMKIWAIAFAAAGIVFAAIPDHLLDYITNIGTGLLGWYAPPLSLGTDRFWTILAVAMMFTISYLCLAAGRNPVRKIGLVRPVLICKFFSAAGFIFTLVLLDRQFIYLVGAVVDGFIFLITWYFYSAALKSRN